MWRTPSPGHDTQAWRGSEFKLAADLRAHAPGAIARLLDAFGHEILGVAYLIVRNHEDAEEVVMDTMMAAWRHSGELREDSALRRWLLKIASRHAITRRRSRRMTVALDADRPEDSSWEPPVDRVVIAQAMEDLPVKIRAAIALHYLVDLSVPQVAKVLGKSENTIKSQLKEGRDRLRRSLVPEERLA